HNFDRTVPPNGMSAHAGPPGSAQVREKLGEIAFVVHPARDAPDPMHRPRARAAAPNVPVLKIAMDRTYQTGPVRERPEIDRQRTFPIEARQRADAIAYSCKQYAERHGVARRIPLQLRRSSKEQRALRYFGPAGKGDRDRLILRTE